MSNIDLILNDLDELLENSWNLPLSGGRCVVDAERVRDLIDGIRVNLPAEIKQAKAVAAERNDILANAKAEAESLIRRAEERAKVLVDNETVVRTANAKATGIINEATEQASKVVNEALEKAAKTVNEATRRASDTITQASQRSKEMKQAAYDFSEGMLRSTEETLNRTLADVKTTRQQLHESASEAASKAQKAKR